MYWTDQFEDDIRRANLDGSDMELLTSTENSPAGIALEIR